jgi:hypothetical protein
MPILFTVDQLRRRIDVRATGLIGSSEMLVFIADRARAGAASYDQLFNAIGGRVELSPAELRAVVAESIRIRYGEPAGLNAIVYDDDMTFRLARELETFAEEADPRTAAFRTVAEAESWLAARQRDFPRLD